MIRNRIPAMLPGLVLIAAVATGCFDTVKLVSISLGNLRALDRAFPPAGAYVDLAADNSTYADNKSKFSDVADVAVLGTFRNNSGAAVSADVWIVENPTDSGLLPDLAAVQAAGGKRVWSLALAANETKVLDWGNSAPLFTSAGKIALKSELEHEAIFTLYVFGSTGSYDITATNASVAVMVYIDFIGP